MFNLYVHHAPANYHFVSDKQNGFGLVLSFFFCDSLNKLPIIQVSLWYGPIILISSTLKCHTKKSLHTIWLFQLRQKTPKFKPDPWKALSDIPAHNHFLLTNSDFTNKDQNKKNYTGRSLSSLRSLPKVIDFCRKFHMVFLPRDYLPLVVGRHTVCYGCMIASRQSCWSVSPELLNPVFRRYC